MQTDLSWTAVLAHHAARTPTKPLTVFEGNAITYEEMAERVAALAGGLADRGVGPGDVVGLLSYNCPEMLETVFAANHLGAIVMPINWRLAAAEVRYILDHSEASALVCDHDLVDLANDATKGLEDTLLRASVSTPGPAGWVSLADLRAGENRPPVVAAAPDDVHRLMYTSGTTGRPKGVMRTHANLAWKNFAHLVEFGFDGDDLGLACGPLYHVGALDLTTTTLRRPGHRDRPPHVRRRRRGRRAGALPGDHGVAGAGDGQRDHGAVRHRAADLSSVRVIINGGEKCRSRSSSASSEPSVGVVRRRVRPHRDRLRRHVPRPGQPRHQAGQRRPAVPVPRARCLGRRRPLRGSRGAGRDRDAGPEGVQGLLAGPQATASAFAGGWFHTGDIGVRDEDGYLFIVDRLKDMIVSGGENIAGSEVERVLYEHDAVLEAAVVARPDERWGEVPVAHVVRREGSSVTADELLDHCRAQLARFKVPKDITFLDALPRNPSGKVLKRELRDGG